MWPLIDQLVQQGVVDFFLAPGSRSTPLAIAVSRHPKAKLHRHFDERGLGFFALGSALAEKKPTAIIVTSGTAVGNLLPAVMEAHHASVPLILLTADRPSELRESSANQTCDQIKLFQNFVRWQFDLDSTMPSKAIRSKTGQAVFRATTPHPGPVHINCPFREPLYPVASDFIQGSPIALEAAQMISAPIELPEKGIILAGRNGEGAIEWGKKLRWPVFADVLSNSRLENSEEQIRNFDWILPQAPRPDCILHFGERLVSKKLMEWLVANPPQQYWHISHHLHWHDPHQLVTGRIYGPGNFKTKPDPSWLATWKKLDEIELPMSDRFTENTAMRSLNNMPLDDWAIFLANSMPIREGDWFLFPKKAKGFFANRGLSGIDGNIATIAGLALHSPVLAFIGDLTALHDINSLALIQNLPVVLIISNNNGCGIFSHLAVSADPHFETLWGFAHNRSFEHAAKLFDIPYNRVANNFSAIVEEALKNKRSHIIELTTSREINAEAHKKMRAACT